MIKIKEVEYEKNALTKLIIWKYKSMKNFLEENIISLELEEALEESIPSQES